MVSTLKKHFVFQENLTTERHNSPWKKESFSMRCWHLLSRSSFGATAHRPANKLKDNRPFIPAPLIDLVPNLYVLKKNSCRTIHVQSVLENRQFDIKRAPPGWKITIGKEPLRKAPQHGGFDSDALLKDASIFQWDEFPMNHFCLQGDLKMCADT